MTVSKDFTALLFELERARSTLDKIQILARSWRSVRRLTRADRIELARRVGFDGAEELLENLATKKGGVAPAMLLEAVRKARRTDASELEQIMYDLKSAGESADAVSDGLRHIADLVDPDDNSPFELKTPQPDTESNPPQPPPAPSKVSQPKPAPEQSHGTAAPEDEDPVQQEVPEQPKQPEPPKPTPERAKQPTPQKEESAPAATPRTAPTTRRPTAVIPPPKRDRPAAAAAHEPRVEKAERSPIPQRPTTPARTASRSPILTPTPTPEDGTEVGWVEHLKALRRVLADSTPATFSSVRDRIGLTPDGWRRRRAILAVIELCPDLGVDEILKLIADLAESRDRIWCTATLIRSRRLAPPEILAVLEPIDSPSAQVRLNALATRRAAM